MAVARAAHSATSHFVLATARLNFGGRQTVELCTAGGVSSVVIAALSSSAGAARLITRPLPLRLLNTHDEGAGRIRVIIWHPPPGGPTAVADGEDRNDLHALRRTKSSSEREIRRTVFFVSSAVPSILSGKSMATPSFSARLARVSL